MKPNVLLFIDSFAQGGTERQVVQLARLLSESGRYQVHLACLNGEGVLRAEAERLGFTNIPEFPLTSFYDRNMLAQLRRCAALLRERSIDIVETHDFYTNIFGMFAAARARTPRVRIASRRETDGTKSRGQKWVQQRAFALADAIVANAEAVRQELIRDGVPPAKIQTIYNGMDTARVAPRPDLRREDALALLGLPREEEGGDGSRRPKRRFVSIVANMRHANKDQAMFLRAARRVREAVPEAAFVLAGEGELRESLIAYARELGLADCAFFTGRCAHVPELLAVSEVCVLSSNGTEGFSNSIIEYMAAARPVVATDIGGAREAVVEGETGYVVAPGDDAVLASRITSLLTDAEGARRMGERGLQVVKEKFSCAAQVERVENLYERLLTQKRAAPQTRLEAGARHESAR
ncbi:MAG TPA: glycosyltransferase [Pyrinomonadaceae bacterium]|jgi:glycosyltransferase involved in cell wall biosynthesis|nr:glycosyltransferase [Pyrinomonadaceae bacterium]